MDNYSYHVAWSERDSAYVAVSPEFPGLSGLGTSAEEAVAELRVAIDLALETFEEEGKAPPEPQEIGEYSGQFRLRLPRRLHAALALRAQAEGVSLNTLAVMYLSEALGAAQSELRSASEYRVLLRKWVHVLETLQSAMVQFNQHTSDKTEYALEGIEFQDPTLRRLYSQDVTVKVETS